MGRKPKQQQKAEEPWVRVGHAQVIAWIRQVGSLMVTNKHGTPVTIYTGRAKCGPYRGQYYVAFNGDQRIYAQQWGSSRLPEMQALAAQAVLDKVKPEPMEIALPLNPTGVNKVPVARPVVSTHEKRLIVALRSIETALKALNG